MRAQTVWPRKSDQPFANKAGFPDQRFRHPDQIGKALFQLDGAHDLAIALSRIGFP